MPANSRWDLIRVLKGNDLTAVPYNVDGSVALGLFCTAALPHDWTVRPESLRFVN